MESWTLGAISIAAAFIVGLIASAKKIAGYMAEAIGKVTQRQIQPLEKKIDTLAEKIEESDLNSMKDFLVVRFAEIDKGQKPDEVTRQRIYEEMERYEKQGGNSYIHTRFDELKKQGRL